LTAQRVKPARQLFSPAFNDLAGQIGDAFAKKIGRSRSLLKPGSWSTSSRVINSNSTRSANRSASNRRMPKCR
jgi:hypothetical protein